MRTTAAGQSALLLLDAVAILRTESVEYAVVGAMAAAVHGVVRASVDADAVVSIAIAGAKKLRDAFAAAGLIVDLRRGDLDDPIPALIEIQDEFGNRVDLLIGLKGLSRDAFVRAVEVPFSGEKLRVVCREDFIAMKLFAGGPQDLLDAERTYEVDPQSIDVELLRRAAQGFGPEVRRRLDDLLSS